MDPITLHKITFFTWLLIGGAFVFFSDRILKDSIKIGNIMARVIFVGLGPGGWIMFGIVWAFQKQYRKNPEAVMLTAFMVGLVIVIALLYLVFPLTRPF